MTACLDEYMHGRTCKDNYTLTSNHGSIDRWTCTKMDKGGVKALKWDPAQTFPTCKESKFTK